MRVVRLGGACRAADTVATCRTAQQDDHITGSGNLTADILCGSGGDDRADLHTLCGIAGMIDLVHNAGRQTDLVAVGAVALCGSGNDLALRELTLDGFGYGNGRISRAGHTHRTVDIGTSRERIADRAADTGRRAAEGLDLGGMVMSLVLEQQEPRLGFAVDLDLHLHGTGVDLLTLVELLELTVLLKLTDGDGREIHQADRLCPAEILSYLDIVVIRRL